MEFRKSPESLAVLVVGTDTLIEALPARPIQLAHACGALGFDLVIPLTWGDELVAESALRALESRAPAPAVLCVCPIVRQRLLQAGTDLAGALVSLAPPSVAVARHLRTNLGDRLGSLTFAGRCPGAAAPLYDDSYDPHELLALMRDRGIRLESQPDEFVDRLPPDRRRYASLPGGCPAPEVLWQRCNETTLIEVESGDIAMDIAQHLLSPQPVLIDVAPALGCCCSGVTRSITGASARVAVTSLEPPRSATPTVTDAVIPELAEAIVDPAAVAKAGLYVAGGARAPMAVTPPGALPIK